ncbi:MAG: hypothetical protein IT406_00165 [Candidatus Yanofskybacteria bacterium]|nr:hypothetical protein [Candidatus Yanofskybacteria bacterium]
MVLCSPGREDIMQGQRYECLERDPEGRVIRRFRAVWIPDAELVVHWDVPHGHKRVERASTFSFEGGPFSSVSLGSCAVPHRCVVAARRYLAQRADIARRLPAIQLAIERYLARHASNDRHMQIELRQLGR